MTASVINLIAVFRIQICPDLPPVCLSAADIPDIPDDIQQLPALHISCRPVQQHIDPLFLESHRFQRRQMAGRLHRDPVVADTGRIPDQLHRRVRISRTCHGDGVNKDLRADLLCQDLSINSSRTAPGRFDPVFQIQIRGMFRRTSQSAPPEDCFIFDDIIQPGISKCLRWRIFLESVIRNGPEKSKCTGNIIIRHDQGHPHLFMDIIPDLSKGIPDLFIAPPFHGPPQIYAEDLSQHPGINIVFVFLYAHRFASTTFIFYALSTTNPSPRIAPESTTKPACPQEYSESSARSTFSSSIFSSSVSPLTVNASLCVSSI